MIKSKYISDIVDQLLKLDKQGREFIPQLEFLSDDEYEYTGAGLFVYFTHEPKIINYRTKNDNLVLEGVTVKSNELNYGADCLLFTSNGLIDYLEIHSKDGQYPNSDILKYTFDIIFIQPNSDE